LASVTHAPVITSATLDTTVTTTANSSLASADVQTVSLLGGLIVANEVVAVSNTTQGGSGLNVTAAGSMFSDLMVLGVPIASNVAANTTIALPGIGRVVLNEQIPQISTSSAQLTVRMIHVYVTVANALHIVAGTEIVVGSAISVVTVPNGPGLLTGFSYGTQITGALIQSGATALEGLGCSGTNGKVISVSTAGISVPSVLNSGTISSAIAGNITPSLISAQTVSAIQSLNILNGVISVKALRLQANTSSTDGVHVKLSDAGTSFTQLVVLGHPEILDTVPANTQVTLLGIGTLYLHTKTIQSNIINVYGITLVISASNTLGLPPQTIIIGRAAVGIVP
jgi:hypothetical protein